MSLWDPFPFKPPSCFKISTRERRPSINSKAVEGRWDEKKSTPEEVRKDRCKHQVALSGSCEFTVTIKANKLNFLPQGRDVRVGLGLSSWSDCLARRKP